MLDVVWNYTSIVTADACVNMACNFLTKALAESSKPATSLDYDMNTLVLKFSRASPAIYGVRVEFVSEPLEAIASSSAWLSPADRRSKRCPKRDAA